MNKFLSRFDADNLRKTVIYMGIAGLLIAISLWIGLKDNFLTITSLFCGIFLFFYALLHPWGKARYYAIMGGICLILLIFELLAGIKILVNMQLKGDLAESIAMFGGFTLVGGIFAGIIGTIRFRKYG
jgi:hypothetical protein